VIHVNPPDVTLLTALADAVLGAPAAKTIRLVSDRVVIDGRPQGETLTQIAKRASVPRAQVLLRALGAAEAHPTYVAARWRGAIKSGASACEFRMLAREITLQDEHAPTTLRHWRAAMKSRLAKHAYEAVSVSVDRFSPGSSPEERGACLELGPILEDWPRELLESLHWRTAQPALPGLPPLQLDDVWVDLQLLEPEDAPLSVASNNPRLMRRGGRVSEPATLLLEHLRTSVLIIGDPGSGKTTLVKWLARRLVLEGTGRFLLPLVVSLRRYARERHERPGLGLLTHAVEAAGVHDPLQRDRWVNTLSYLAQTSKENVLLFLDGWDEVPEADRDAVFDQIEATAYAFAMVITSRRSGHPWRLPADRRYEIGPLGRAAADRLMRRWFQAAKAPHKADRLRAKLDAHPELDELARNPFLLTLLCGLAHQSGDAHVMDLPASRTALYERAIHAIAADPVKPLSFADLHGCERLALWLFTNAEGAPRFIFGLEDGVAAALPATLITPKLERSRLATQIHLDQQTFQFIHASFQEFLAARRIINLDDKSWPLLEEHLRDPRWLETLRFVAGGGLAGPLAEAVRELACRPDIAGFVYTILARLLSEASAVDDPLAAEGGVAILGFDLRDKLWGRIEAGFEPEVFADAYIALDPDHLFARIEQRLPTASPKLHARLERLLGRFRRRETARAIVDRVLGPAGSTRAIAIYSAAEALDIDGLVALRRAVSDRERPTDIRKAAIMALGNARDGGALEVLLPQLNNPKLANETARALGRLGGDEALNALAACVTCGDDRAPACTAALGETRDPRARDHLVTVLARRDASDPLIPDLLEALIEFPIREGAPVLHDLLTAAPDAIRTAAAWALEKSTHSQTTEALAIAIRADSSPSTRAAAVGALRERARPDQVSWLLKIAQDPTEAQSIRADAMTAVLQAALRFAHYESGPELRRIAARAVLEALEETQGELALAAATHAYAGGVAVIAQLVEITTNTTASFGVREAACHALGKLRHRDAINDLLALVKQAPKASDGSERVILEATSRIASAAAQALTQIDASALAGLGSPVAIAALTRHAVETGQLVFSQPLLDPSGGFPIAIISAPEDNKHAKALCRALAVMVRNDELTLVDPVHEICRARLVLPLLSSDLLSWEPGWQAIATVMSAHPSTDLIPIIIRVCDWRSSAIGQLAPLPNDGTAILSNSNLDEAWQTVVEGVRSLVLSKQKINNNIFI